MSGYSQKIIFLFVLFAVGLLCLPFASALIVVSNSADWKDIYSTIQYGYFVNAEIYFLVSERHAQILVQSVRFINEDVFLTTSPGLPFAFGYGNTLRAEGAHVEEISSTDITLDLARRLIQNNSIHSFIILDDSYGYNAISVAPYASLTRSFVLFADQDNIGDVLDVLQAVPDVNVTIFGHVDREVRDALAPLNPLTVNYEDRFLNNIAINQMFVDTWEKEFYPRGVSQIILTDGEFIEASLFSPNYPMIFLGKTNVPDVVHDFVRNNTIAAAVLVGNQYVGSASTLRRELGISVFVKFARSARVPEGPMAQVEGLDLYYLPVYDVDIDIESMVYNEATNKLEVTIRNKKDILAYFKGTYTLTYGNNERVVVGDLDPVFIDANDIITLTYDAELTGSISGKAFVVFGESPYSMENTLEKTFDVQKTKVFDASSLQINSLLYNLKSGNFYVEAQNVGDVDLYTDVNLVDVKVAGEKFTFSAADITKIKPGKTAKIKIVSDPRMLKDDIPDNKKVKVVAVYGERETNLIKRLSSDFDLKIQSIDFVFWILVIIIIILFFLILFSRRRKKEKEGHHHH